MNNESKIQKLRNEIKVIREMIGTMASAQAIECMNIAIDKAMEIVALGGKIEPISK